MNYKKSNPKINHAVLMQKVQEVISDNTTDPADDLIALGSALKAIGETIKGLSYSDAKAVLTAAAAKRSSRD